MQEKGKEEAGAYHLDASIMHCLLSLACLASQLISPRLQHLRLGERVACRSADACRLLAAIINIGHARTHYHTDVV